MVLGIDEVITDHLILREGYIIRDGFVFTKGQSNPVVYDRLLIRVPDNAHADGQRLGYSFRTVDEHIELVNKLQIEKVMVICDDLNFILKCPSVRDIKVYPSFGAEQAFDYTPLYKLPVLQCVDCKTIYGDCNNHKTTIDYSKITGLEEVAMVGSGHIKFEGISSLKRIWLSDNKRVCDFTDVSCSSKLQKVTLFQCGIQSMEGIEKNNKLNSVVLYYNRALKDISGLKNIAETLNELVIECCPKITDFSALNSLVNLEHLQLYGNNLLPDLEFLKGMKKLKTFTFTMKVENGDLKNCMNVPYVSCKNYKHYNFKDKDLPKG